MIGKFVLGTMKRYLPGLLETADFFPRTIKRRAHLEGCGKYSETYWASTWLALGMEAAIGNLEWYMDVVVPAIRGDVRMVEMAVEFARRAAGRVEEPGDGHLLDFLGGLRELDRRVLLNYVGVGMSLAAWRLCGSGGPMKGPYGRVLHGPAEITLSYSACGVLEHVAGCKPAERVLKITYSTSVDKFTVVIDHVGTERYVGAGRGAATEQKKWRRGMSRSIEAAARLTYAATFVAGEAMKMYRQVSSLVS